MKHNSIKTGIFKKFFITDSLIIIFILLSLVSFAINKIQDNYKDEQLFLNKRVIDDVTTFINRQHSTSKIIVENLYNDYSYLNDMIKYLNSPIEDYLKYKLDSFLESNKVYYKGVESFLEKSFESNNTIERITLYSYIKDEIYVFTKSKGIRTYKLNVDENGQYDSVEEAISKKLDELYGDENEYKYNIYRDLRDPDHLNKIGIIGFTYSVNDIKEILSKYEKSTSRITLIAMDETVIYNSEKKGVGEKYPYAESLLAGNSVVKLEEPSYIDFKLNNSGITVIGSIPEAIIKRYGVNAYTAIILLGISLLIIAEIMIYIKSKKLEMKINNVLYAMEAVEKGDFSVKIPVDNSNDEISLISYNFNSMCKKLEKYINKSYVAELNQKKAELISLENQINPHFLYNTLESIRMKAVCNGDKEVGKMLYILATLFRFQVKEKGIITIAQEVKYAKMYLELFKFKYDNNYEYYFYYDEDILSNEIMKLTIQPLVENYLVHGINMDSNNNVVIITIRKVEDYIEIEIKDNGVGIEDIKLNEIKEKLHKGEYNGNSIGLINVHERIRMYYGKKYGVSIEKGEIEGTKVTVKVPCKGVVDNV